MPPTDIPSRTRGSSVDFNHYVGDRSVPLSVLNQINTGRFPPEVEQEHTEGDTQWTTSFRHPPEHPETTVWSGISKILSDNPLPAGSEYEIITERNKDGTTGAIISQKLRAWKDGKTRTIVEDGQGLVTEKDIHTTIGTLRVKEDGIESSELEATVYSTITTEGWEGCLHEGKSGGGSLRNPDKGLFVDWSRETKRSLDESGNSITVHRITGSIEQCSNPRHFGRGSDDRDCNLEEIEKMSLDGTQFDPDSGIYTLPTKVDFSRFGLPFGSGE